MCSQWGDLKSGCWEGPQTNLLLKGVMPQPHSGPTLPQCERDGVRNVDGDISDVSQVVCNVDGKTNGSGETSDKKVAGHVMGHKCCEPSDLQR